MSEKKYLVPQDMLKAAHIAVGAERPWGNITVPETRATLEGAIRWLSENPIVPTDEQVQEMRRTRNKGSERRMHYMVEWQRRMFLAPEPEVPDAVKDLLWRPRAHWTRLDVQLAPYDAAHDEDVLEAYRRGKAGK